MPNFNAAISPEDSDEAVRLLTECCNDAVNRISYSEFEGPASLAQLQTYYAGAYRELDAVGELLHQGYWQIPAADRDDDDWERFANSLHIYETCGDLTLFQPWPTPDHDYTDWVEPSVV